MDKMVRTTRTSAARLLAVAGLLVGLQALVRAHDVPDEIDIQSYLKPAGTELQVLLRIPLLAVTDANLPKDGTGYLAMPYLDPALRDAANQSGRRDRVPGTRRPALAVLHGERAHFAAVRQVVRQL